MTHLRREADLPGTAHPVKNDKPPLGISNGLAAFLYWNLCEMTQVFSLWLCCTAKGTTWNTVLFRCAVHGLSINVFCRVQPVEMMGACSIKVPADNCTCLISLGTSVLIGSSEWLKQAKWREMFVLCFTVQSLEEALLRCRGALWFSGPASWLGPCSV